jgi:hypothetical protein
MSKQDRLLLLSDLMLLVVAVVWGTSYGIVKNALVFYPVLGLLTLRFGITFVMLSPALRSLRYADARTLRGVFIVRRACATAWGCKSPVQPDGGEGLAKRKGVVVRRGLKEARSKAAT